jgi:hypothetical protein
VFFFSSGRSAKTQSVSETRVVIGLNLRRFEVRHFETGHPGLCLFDLRDHMRIWQCVGKLGRRASIAYALAVAITGAGSIASFALPGSAHASGPVAPEVTAVSPNHGAPSGGTSITVTGHNFSAATAVRFGPQNGGGGGPEATSFTVNSDTSITAVTPKYAGVVDVVVVGPGGSSATNPRDAFAYGPIVTQMAPRSGPASGGTEVTLRGFGFEEATGVDFGSGHAVSFHANPDGSITAIAPQAAPGSSVVAVTVMTPEGPSTSPAAPESEPANYFSYAPIVSSVEPASGPAIGGTHVTIRGSGFESPLIRCLCGPFVETVQFGPDSLNCGLPFGPASPSCAPIGFEVISDSEITAITPPGVGVVDLGVRTAGGTSPVNPNVRFRYEPAVESGAGSASATGATASTSGNDGIKACLDKARATFGIARKAAKSKTPRARARALRHARKGKRKRVRACWARL